MSLYQRRIDAIMVHHNCNACEAAEIMKVDFAHDEVPAEDEIDRLFRENEED